MSSQSSAQVVSQPGLQSNVELFNQTKSDFAQDVDIAPGGYGGGKGIISGEKVSMFKTQSLPATILIVLLLVGNAALFIWSNLRCVCECVYLSVGMCVCVLIS